MFQNLPTSTRQWAEQLGVYGGDCLVQSGRMQGWPGCQASREQQQPHRVHFGCKERSLNMDQQQCSMFDAVAA